MSCCDSSTQSNDPGCPGCGHAGKGVGRITLESLVKPEHAALIGDQPYHFCESRSCETVYFDGHGSVFVKSELTVRVGLKETDSPRPACYCFDHSIEEVEEQVRRTGRSTVLDEIKARLPSGCWCESKNPQGRCCVRVVRACIERAMRERTKGTGTGDESLGIGETDPGGPCC